MPQTIAPANADDEILLTEMVSDDVEEAEPSKAVWIMPALAGFAIIAWTGFFVFANHQEMLAGAPLQQWTGWITAWASPALLVIGVWLLAMRSSTREAGRFRNVARELTLESAKLENRLTTVNRELSLAREFIASQSRDLESLGRVAGERLSTHAAELEGLIKENSSRVESIESVSISALENMDKLRGELPVIATSARDVTSQIGNAGRTAHTQLNDMISGFHRLNEFGEASERQVAALRAKIDAAIASFEDQATELEETTRTHFDLLDQRGEAARGELEEWETKAFATLNRRSEALRKEISCNWDDFDAKETAALASLQSRFETLRNEAEEFAQKLRESESSANESWAASIEGLRQRLTAALEEVATVEAAGTERTQANLQNFSEKAQAIDTDLAERAERSALSFESRLDDIDAVMAQRHEQQLTSLAEFVRRTEELTTQFGELGNQIETISTQGAQASGDLVKNLELINAKLERNERALQSADTAIGELTQASAQLLELIQSSEGQSREELPTAIDAAQEKLAAFEERTIALAQMLTEAGSKGQSLSEYVLAAQNDSKAAFEQLDHLYERLSERGEANNERIDALRRGLAELSQESEGLSEKVDGDLSEAVERLQTSLRETLAKLGDGQNQAVEEFAENIGEQSAQAIQRSIKTHADGAIEELEEAATHASQVSREAAVQLRDQLTVVAELAGNLEARVAQARERAQEQVDNDFSRRAALITESLNSNAIDISKALSNEVTDTAWASYLRGDRGIFTRRAVSLLEHSEAKEIVEIYQRDSDFREHVSRYIHDFESMLRTMLSTRDGKALGVTLLSSDMGKLYVALAQAIERLRD